MKIMIVTPRCSVCHEAAALSVDKDSYEAWKGGMLVQNAFPTMPRAVREQLITGIHPACWKKLFGEHP